MTNFITAAKKHTGKWVGYYKYDNHPNYNSYYEVPFTIELEGGLFGRFKGTVQDDSEQGGMKEVGVISGYIYRGKISFKKKMPTFNAYTQSGEQLSDSIKHPTIYYKGIYDEREKKFHGTWLIQGGGSLQSKGNVYLKMKTSGTWAMTMF